MAIENDCKILFITDVHQNITAIKKLKYSDYDLVLCGGDLLDPSKPDFEIAKEIVDSLPSDTVIIPGNCDKDPKLLEYMDAKLNYIHKKMNRVCNVPIFGIGFCRHLKADMKVYRQFFKENHSRIFNFLKNNKLTFLLEFCGIIVGEDDKINFIPEEEAYNLSRDFISKFNFFEEEEIVDAFSDIQSLSNGILLTHSPPHGMLDKLDGLPNIGSSAILDGVKKTRPALILCGHFHELPGSTEFDNSVVFNPGALKDNKYGEIVVENGKISVSFKEI